MCIKRANDEIVVLGRRRNNRGNLHNVSDGYWLCSLIPSAMLSNLIAYWMSSSSHFCEINNYIFLTLISMVTFYHSAIFFLGVHNVVKLTYNFHLISNQIPPIMVASIMKLLVPNSSWLLLFIFIKVVSYIHLLMFRAVIIKFHNTFTYGESCLVSQGFLVFTLSCTVSIYEKLFSTSLKMQKKSANMVEFDNLSFIITIALFWLSIICILFFTYKKLCQTLQFYSLIIAYGIYATCLPITQPLPIIYVAQYILEDYSRVYLLLYYMAILIITFGAIKWHLNRNCSATTVVRKIFHVILLLVYIPGILYEHNLIYFASGVALAVMVIMELVRIFHIPPYYTKLQSAFQAFAVKRDYGLIAATPFTLIIGVSLPLWLQLPPCVTPNEEINNKLTLLAGVITVGIGDTAASIIGYKFGRIKWPNSSRTVEGTGAFIVTTLLFYIIVVLFGYIPVYSITTNLFISFIIIIIALVEAHTDQIDNIVLPLIFYTTLNLIVI